MVINTKDCLDEENEEKYLEIVNQISLSKMREEGYFKLEPKIRMLEHQEIKAYLIIGLIILFQMQLILNIEIAM